MENPYQPPASALQPPPPEPEPRPLLVPPIFLIGCPLIAVEMRYFDSPALLTRVLSWASLGVTATVFTTLLGFALSGRFILRRRLMRAAFSFLARSLRKTP